jgi:hypothetical protein
MTRITSTEARQLTMDSLSASQWIVKIEDEIKASALRGEWGTEIYSPTFYARFISDADFRTEIYLAYPDYFTAADPNRSSVYISWFDPNNPPAFQTSEGVELRRALDRGFLFFQDV